MKTLEERAAWQREYRQKNREKINGINRRYRARNPQKVRAWERKHKHENLGYPTPTRPMPDKCELCDKLPRNGHVLHLDHDHVTGAFRGWLCGVCNPGLGMLGDTVEALQKAVDYLKRALQ